MSAIRAETEELIKITLRKETVILIAEDDKGHYLLTKNYLRKAGIENDILWFKDGQEVLDFLLNEPKGGKRGYLLLLDIRMPKLDGVEVLKRLKENSLQENLAVIMLTTSEDHELAALCYEQGCFAHIVKPPGIVLLKAIKRISQQFYI